MAVMGTPYVPAEERRKQQQTIKERSKRK